jgi:DNA modification methylase
MSVEAVLSGERSWHVEQGHVLDLLRQLPDESVHAVVTSPPYWGLRDYGLPPQVWGGDEGCTHEWGRIERTPWANEVPGPSGIAKNTAAGHWKPKEHGQWCSCGAWLGSLGLEPTVELYVEHVVEVFREVRRVLRKDGTLWLNMGDSYATGGGKVGEHPGGPGQGDRWKEMNPGLFTQPNRMPQEGLKPKDLVGMPWRVAFALQADGWWLRSDIIWSKPNPMPESVRDRPTKAHEYLFLLAKNEYYFFDQEAVREPDAYPNGPNAPDKIVSPYGQGFTRRAGKNESYQGPGSASRRLVGLNQRYDEREAAGAYDGRGRNIRSVWTISTAPFPDAHFATFPKALVEPCIKAGTPPGGLVLDPFAGAGTTGLVALRLGRRFLGIELSEKYVEMARGRIVDDAPLFNTQP